MGKMCSSSADKLPSYQRVKVASSSLNLITLCYRLKVFGFPGNLGNITSWPWILQRCPWLQCWTKLWSRSCLCFFCCSYLLILFLDLWGSQCLHKTTCLQKVSDKGLPFPLRTTYASLLLMLYSNPSKLTSTLNNSFHRQWTNISILQDYIEYLLWVNIQYLLWASLLAQLVKNLPAMWKTWVWSLGWEDPLEEGMTTHSSTPAWRIPMDRGAWQATVYEVAKSGTWLSDWAQHSTW